MIKGLFLILCFVFLLTSSQVQAELLEHGKLIPILEVEGITAGDMGGGKIIGPESFYVDGEKIYLLASEDKKLFYFNNGELIKAYNLDYMTYPTVVKVNNNVIYIVDGRAMFYELNNNGDILENDIIKPDEKKWPRIKDIKFDRYERPVLLDYNDSVIKLIDDSKEEKYTGLYFKNSKGTSFEIKKGKVMSLDNNFEFKVKSMGSGAISRELLYIDQDDNFYVNVNEKGLRTLRKYDYWGELVGICKLPSDRDKVVYYPYAGRSVLIKDKNNIYTIVSYKEKTVIYKVELVVYNQWIYL